MLKAQGTWALTLLLHWPTSKLGSTVSVNKLFLPVSVSQVGFLIPGFWKCQQLPSGPHPMPITA